jgi:hypothetical protein
MPTIGNPGDVSAGSPIATAGVAVAVAVVFGFGFGFVLVSAAARVVTADAGTERLARPSSRVRLLFAEECRRLFILNADPGEPVTPSHQPAC